MRRYYHNRVEAGQCRSCPKPTRPGRTTCLQCGLRYAEKAKARYDAKKAERAKVGRV